MRPRAGADLRLRRLDEGAGRCQGTAAKGSAESRRCKTGAAAARAPIDHGPGARRRRRFQGQIYNAENGKSYAISVWREPVGGLKIQGCMMSVFCATQTWTETTSALPGQLVGMTGDSSGPRRRRSGRGDPVEAAKNAQGRQIACACPGFELA